MSNFRTVVERHKVVNPAPTWEHDIELNAILDAAIEMEEALQAVDRAASNYRMSVKQALAPLGLWAILGKVEE